MHSLCREQVGEWVSKPLGSGLRVSAFKFQLGYSLSGATLAGSVSQVNWENNSTLLTGGHWKHLGSFSLERLAGIITVPLL